MSPLANGAKDTKGGAMNGTTRNCQSGGIGYALVTAAYNEEKYLARALDSIVAQSVTPKKWIIVSDGSTDRTDEIVDRYASQNSFIELYRVTEEHARNLTAQVNAINRGFARLKDVDCSFIGNLDADISLEPTYFESLLGKFLQDPNLGLAGGFICEERAGEFRSRRANSVTSVAHAVQLFRRECLEALGGYRPFSWAGADTYAEVSLRMKGWHVQSFPELKAMHHRPTGSGFGNLRYSYRGGGMDFYMGVHPVFEIFRLVRRVPGKPYVLGSLARLAGFILAYCRGEKRQVPDDFVRFRREEQMQRLRLYLMRPFRCFREWISTANGRNSA
jgi:poly-beta-1,6-N-acetyl-D-glucosamine synthase